jgi:hypothetical protein
VELSVLEQDKWDCKVSYLGTGVGCTQKVTDGGTGNSCRSTASTTLNRRDGSDGNVLLAETGLDVGDQSRDEDNLGNHICDLKSVCLFGVKNGVSETSSCIVNRCLPGLENE